MTEDKYTEKISLWLDDELDTTEQLQLRQHLSECADCRLAYERMKHIDRLLRHAAQVMATPSPGFGQRFETRLAEYHPQKLWHIWVALLALMVGSLLFVVGWGIWGGLAVASYGATLLNTRLLTQSVFLFADTAENLRLYSGLGVLVFKTSLITMQQPLFWGFVVIAAASGGLWVRFMRQIVRRGTVSARLVF